MSGVISNPHLGGSVMVQLGTVAGNTSGASTYRGTNIVLEAGSNLTIEVASQSILRFHGASGGGGGLTTAAQSDHSHGALSLYNLTGTSSSNGLTLSAAAPGGGGTTNQTGPNIADSVATITSGTVVFANSNGVSFGLNGSTMTGSHNGYSGATTQWLTTAQPPGAYLTTAAQSDHSHAFATTTTGGASIVVGTTNSSGVTIGVPAFLTTAQAPGAYLTTARASSDAVGLNTALTANGVSWTVNSSGLSLNFPAFLTTAAQSGHSHAFATTTTNGASIIVGTTNSNGVTIAVPAYLTTAQPVGAYLTTARASNDAIGLNSALTANGVSMSANSSGLSLNFPAFLTTAAQSGHSHAFATTTTNGSLINVATSGSAGVTIAVPPFITVGGGGAAQSISAGTTSYAANPVAFSNSNGISFGFGAGASTSIITGSHNALTTARASNDAVGLNSALTANGVSWTVNSSGLSLNVPAFLTTAAQSGHIHGNPTLNLTNLSGTTASASNGLTLSLSAAAPGGGAGATVFDWPNYPPALASSSCYTGATGATGGSSQTTVSLYVCPMILPVAVGFQEMEIYASHGAFSAGTGSASAAHMIGIYTLEGGTRLNLSTYGIWNLNISQNSATAYSAAWWFGTNSAAAGAGSSTSWASSNASVLFAGIKNIKLTDNASHTLSAGEYYLAHAYSMRSSNANILASFGTAMYLTGSQTTGGVYFGSATTNTAPPYRWMGIVTTTSNGTTTGYNVMPQTIQTSAITGTGGASQWRWLAPHLYT